MNTSQRAQDTAHPTQHTGGAHRRSGAKGIRTPHTQHSTPSGHTGEQEPSGPGHGKHKATHGAGTPVNRSQVAQDTAHTCTTRAGRETGKKQHPMGWTHWGDPADPLGQRQGRYPKAAGPSPVRLHRGQWQTSPGAMEATGDR